MARKTPKQEPADKAELEARREALQELESSDGWEVILQAVRLSLKHTRDRLETAQGERLIEAQGEARAYRHLLSLPGTLKVQRQ